MFSLKKTIILALVVLAVVSVAVAAYMVGHMIGYNQGMAKEQRKQHELIMRMDSLLRKQTEQCHSLMNYVYTDKLNSQ